MILGHYGVALAAKRVAPRTSLGTLILPAQWLDELWPVLLLVGVEHVRIVPGLMAASPLDFLSYPFSHSLLLAVAWGVLFALVYFVRRRYRAGAWVVGVAVVTHWLLDAIVHRPDLPLWPGSAARVGAGVWSSIPATIAIELLLLAIGLVIYVRTTRARDRIGSWGLGAMIALLVLIFVSGFAGSPPPSERALAVVTLGLWLFVPWGYWVDRHRELRTIPSGVRVDGETARLAWEVAWRPVRFHIRAQARPHPVPELGSHLRRDSF
jgi:membrane-bound metal-dependent hydrolase YbcI (DUF457 family)